MMMFLLLSSLFILVYTQRKQNVEKNEFYAHSLLLNMHVYLNPCLLWKLFPSSTPPPSKKEEVWIEASTPSPI